MDGWTDRYFTAVESNEYIDTIPSDEKINKFANTYTKSFIQN